MSVDIFFVASSIGIVARQHLLGIVVDGILNVRWTCGSYFCKSWKSSALSTLQTYRKEAVLISSRCLLSVWRSHECPWLSVHSTKHLTEIYWRPFVPQQTIPDHFVIQTENNIFYQHYQQTFQLKSKPFVEVDNGRGLGAGTREFNQNLHCSGRRVWRGRR